MEGTKPRMPCVHTGVVACLFWWQHETGVTAGTLFTLNVCQAGDFPAGTTGPTPRWDHSRATGTVRFLKVPAWRCLKRRRFELKGQFEKCSEGHVFGEPRRHSLCKSQVFWRWKRSDCTFHSEKTARPQDLLKMVFATRAVYFPLPVRRFELGVESAVLPLVWPVLWLAVENIVKFTTVPDCHGLLLPKKD